MRYLFSLVITLFLSFVVEGRELSFKTNTLERIFFELAEDVNNVPLMSNGQVVLGVIDDTPWYIFIDSTDFVSNVGFKLFDEDIRSCIPNEVADFIERYMMEIYLCPKTGRGEKLKQDRVSFLSNRIPAPADLHQPQSFSLKRDEEGYLAEWNAGGKNHAMMFFPAAFEIILGAGQIEMEDRMAIDILKENVDFFSSLESNLVPLDDDKDILRTSPVETYYIESLSNSRFFRFDNQSGTPTPIFDSEKMEESVFNILLLDCYDNIDLHITQSLYGFKTALFTVKLGQWKNFCARNCLKSFVGIESISDDKSVKALLIARNESVGYNHMLSIVISKDVLDGTDNSIVAILHGYIPTHNVLTLF